MVHGDYEILKYETNYIKSELLKEDEDERYEEIQISDKKGNIYEHCIKTIERSLNFGENGLPRIGSGDWNDSMNEIKGESVWLGFFLYDILRKFCKICEHNEDYTLKNKYEKIMEKLKYTLNTVGWDGRWYKRAYFSNGTILGSMQNDECKMDSISQSWSVISKAGDIDKIGIAMDSMDSYLVDRENMIIKLLAPSFCNTKVEPGYIKSYIPGIRENGGQYTHGVIWSIVANCILNNGDRAWEYFRIINPIEHARTKENAQRYKVEPYVVAADVYSNENLLGRGGWTWYTGSSSWFYISGLRYILGFDKKGDKFKIKPVIPKEWDGYEISYKYLDTIYEIKIRNPKHKNAGISNMYLDNSLIQGNEVTLINDEKTHFVEVEM